MLKITAHPLKITAYFIITLGLIATVIRWDAHFAVGRLFAAGALILGWIFSSIGPLPQMQQLWKKPMLYNTLITLGILFVIGDEFVQPWWLFVLGFAAGAIKRWVRWRQQPLFNPAAAGLWVASWVGILPTWWGVSFAPRLTSLEISTSVLLILPVMVYVVQKYRKWATVIPLILSFLVMLALLEQRLPLTPVLEGTLLFFALTMATEPKTSPTLRNEQLIFGVAVGVGAAALAKIQWLPHSYLTALLLANLGYKIGNWLKMNKMPGASQTAQPEAVVTPSV